MENEIKEENLDNFLAQLNKLNQIITSFKESTKIASYCFNKCVSYPEKSLSKSNKKCIWNCTQRYLECDYFIKRRSKDKKNLSNFNLLDDMNKLTKLSKLSNDSEYILKD
ncbi:mitochondrial import inner membrane translocase subunit TIM8, putative [Plasmodium gallinaceum]|uniref:Mitochondrial import inner membrane translocase subunit n=1 Tax=Plasmodium gallinaceum TaxID=5849 RepID=A0A1J1GTV9_PLAGA|nr:mitochondrial import inner membrane translocase subunit TIM8, putative [Plasmodium gallinaceum]CRG95729.1 mitochondrial import inner membrane translocase subunit TIM8, putative [Plasmodium gallinaceum]